MDPARTTPLSLKAVIAGVLEIDSARLDENSGINVTENWDSLNPCMIMAAVERDFDARLAFRDMEDVSSVGAIRTFLLRQGIVAAD